MSLHTFLKPADLKRSRLIALLVAMLLSMSLTACGDDDTPQDEQHSDVNNDRPDAGHDASEDAGDHSDTDDTDPDAGHDDPDSGDPDVGNPTPSGIEIAGIYTNAFGGVETISDTHWKTESDGFPALNTKIDSYDNDDNIAITQNPEDAEYSPNAFNKIVWTEPDADGAFFYCTVDFGLDSAEEALASTESADASDPENSGCGGFAWTQLTPYEADETPSIEIAGVYDSNFEGVETISDSTWETASAGFDPFVMRIDSFDNDENIAITQNIADENYPSEEFNRIVWTEPDAAGIFYYCTVDFGLESAEEAENSQEVADDSDPENSGCGGYAWTQLTPQSGL